MENNTFYLASLRMTDWESMLAFRSVMAYLGAMQINALSLQFTQLLPGHTGLAGAI
jgi:hypothetical protein